MESDEQALLDRVRRHDLDAMAEFLQLRRPQLLAFVERNMGAALRRKVDPEDVVQEVGVECVRALQKVDLSQRDPFSWLCQLAERRIIDAHRHFFDAQKRDAKRELPLGEPANETGKAGLIGLLVASMTTPSQAFSRDQRHMRLLHALEQLPENSREALRLRYVEGLGSKEISQRLNKSDGAVRVLLTRSLRRLEELLEAGSPSPDERA